MELHPALVILLIVAGLAVPVYAALAIFEGDWYALVALAAQAIGFEAGPLLGLGAGAVALALVAIAAAKALDLF